jgi:hypothetical protein
MEMLVDEVYQKQITENMSSQNPGPEMEKPARCKRIDKRGDSKKGGERMSLKIQKISSRGNRTEFGDETSFIARSGFSVILRLTDLHESENSREWMNVRICQVRKDAVRRRQEFAVVGKPQWFVCLAYFVRC